MKFRDRLRRFAHSVRTAVRSAGRMVWPGYGGQGYGWRLLLPGTQYDYQAAAGDLWRNTAIAACLGWLKRNFPEPRLEAVRTERDGSKTIVPDSMCVRCLNRPNKFYGRYTFWSIVCLSLVVDGNCYLRKIRSAAGVVVELWWMPHWLVWPRWNPDGSEYIGWYEYDVNGRLERLPVEDVVHIRVGVDPRNDRCGFSEVKQAVRSVVGLNECDTYTAAILRNMGIPGVVISPGSPDVSFQQDDIDVFKDQWRENYTSEGRGDPLVGTRMFKVEKLSLTPEELCLDKIPARMEDQICAAIGIPAMVVGLTSGAQHKTYANYGEARKAAYEDCLIPLQKMIAEELTIQLLGDFPDDADELRWDYAGIQCLAESEDAQAERIGSLYQTHQVITRAEAREALGYDWTEEDVVYAAFVKAAAKALPGPKSADGSIDPAATEPADDGAGTDPATNGAAPPPTDPAQQIFGYHIQLGVVSDAEARKQLGLPPGDEAGSEHRRELNAKIATAQAAVKLGVPLDEAIRVAGLEDEIDAGEVVVTPVVAAAGPAPAAEPTEEKRMAERLTRALDLLERELAT